MFLGLVSLGVSKSEGALPPSPQERCSRFEYTRTISNSIKNDKKWIEKLLTLTEQ
jgi:hypothetical protein